jgi:deaminated glutathione amidase
MRDGSPRRRPTLGNSLRRTNAPRDARPGKRRQDDRRSAARRLIRRLCRSALAYDVPMRVGLIQLSSGDDMAANAERAEELLHRAGEAGIDVAALPEVWPRQGSAPQMREAAQPIPGPTTRRLAEIARTHRMWVHGGSVLELDGDRVFNTSLLFDRDGALVATYRKIHLFDADPPGAVPSRESYLFASGDEVVVAETEFGRAGMSICYDVRFPELYRALAVRGATLVFVPAAFRAETGIAHWDVLLRARAIEDQCFVIAAAQCGTWGSPGRERHNFGNSMVVDPWGRVVARAADGSGLTCADVDLDEVRRVREVLPALRHRRLNPSC